MSWRIRDNAQFVRTYKSNYLHFDTIWDTMEHVVKTDIYADVYFENNWLGPVETRDWSYEVVWDTSENGLKLKKKPKPLFYELWNKPCPTP